MRLIETLSATRASRGSWVTFKAYAGKCFCGRTGVRLAVMPLTIQQMKSVATNFPLIQQVHSQSPTPKICDTKQGVLLLHELWEVSSYLYIILSLSKSRGMVDGNLNMACTILIKKNIGEPHHWSAISSDKDYPDTLEGLNFAGSCKWHNEFKSIASQRQGVKHLGQL